MIRAVLWDIDGTLVDSEPCHFESMVAVCRAHGHTLSQADQHRLLGHSAPETYALINAMQPLPIDLPEYIRSCTDWYVANSAAVPPRRGALERIDWLAGRGIPQACVSNSGRPVVEANLRLIDRPDAIAFSISRDDVVHGKPHPEPYLRAAERLGIPPSECLVIEDSPVGVRAGKAAGMVTVAWPQHADIRFDAADHQIADLDELDWDALVPLR